MSSRTAPAIATTLKHAIITGARPGPTLLISAGVHGDEYEGMAAIRRLRRQIAPDLLSGRLILVPVVNEGAFRRNARTAEDGLDLARTCPGDAGGTETQRVASEITRLIGAADYYIDLHSGGLSMRTLPLCGYALHRDPEILAEQRRMAAAFGSPLVWGTTPTLDGRTLSAARDARVPAIYAEWGGSGTCDPEGVDAYVRGCRAVMHRLGMLPAQPDAPPAPRWIIEDDRPGSGFMQICHPSPIDGMFEATVALGDRVARGQRLGTVFDELGTQEHPILASEGGMVTVVHSLAHVRNGEGMVVVIDVDGASR
jgi:predicted deacylase